MNQEQTQPELNSINALNEKMYRLGYEDAENKLSFGASITETSNVTEQQGMKVEQLTLF